MDVLDWLSELPVGLMYAGFLTFAVVRGWTYYLSGYLSGRIAGKRATGERWEQAQAKVAELGPKAVIMTWPVYGLAATTQIACGAAKVSRVGFGTAVLFMASIWAGLQTLVGVAVLQTLATKAAPVIVVVLLAVVGTLVIRSTLNRRRELGA